MNNSIMTNNSRRDFLKKAGSVALFAYMGIQFSSCVKDDDKDAVPNTPSGNTVNTDVVQDNGNNSGDTTPDISQNGNVISINLDSDTFSRLKNNGNWLLVTSIQTLIVNTGDDNIRAFTSVCTHSGCDRNWNYTNNNFVCTCHNSVFGNDGKRLSGPASRDLNEFAVSREENILKITK